VSFLQVLRVALRALARSKMRSFLTVLGIVIGIIAVIVSVALGDGTRAKVQASFDSMGANMLMVQSGTTTSGGTRGGFGSMPTLTWDDLTAIGTQLSAVKYAAPYLRSASSILSEDSNWSTQIIGTSPDWFAIRDWKTAQGALFSQLDVDGATKVIVLGRTVADQLFGTGVNPVGQQVRVRSVPFQVAGVLTSKGQSTFGQDMDDIAAIPFTTFRAKIQGGLKNYLQGQIVVGAAGPEYTTPAENQIRALLRDRHRLREGTDDDFQIRNLADAASAMDESMGAIAMLLKVFAAVSLLVGGIGIMNIMLVSVTERTREIGVRMAVGARGRDVLLQFLTEAMVLATLGGVVGVGAGIGIASLLGRLLGWSLLFRIDVIVLAVSVSGAIGIVFGAYPARRASRLDPIQALRFE
jgi:putative ABC transport system permease protein